MKGSLVKYPVTFQEVFNTPDSPLAIRADEELRGQVGTPLYWGILEQIIKIIMDNDKQKELVVDSIMEGVSNCCGANVYRPDICSDCKEYCEIIKLEEIED